MRIAVYPGSFDPITNGHMDILKRSLKVFDKVVLLVAVNPSKKSIFTVEERLAMMKEAVQGLKNVKVEVVWDPTWDKEMMSEAAKLQLGFL